MQKLRCPTNTNNTVNATMRGYVLTWLLLIALSVSASTLLTMAIAESAINKRKIESIRKQYLAESIIDISQSLIKNQLADMDSLLVFYDYDSSGETKLPVDSLPIYIGDSDKDFGDIQADAERIIYQESANYGKISCEISVVNKLPEELKLHSLDKNADLLYMDNTITGELLPIEYAITVWIKDIKLVSLFCISGVKFAMLDDTPPKNEQNGIMVIGLLAENLKITTSSFYYE